MVADPLVERGSSGKQNSMELDSKKFNVASKREENCVQKSKAFAGLSSSLVHCEGVGKMGLYRGEPSKAKVH